MFPYGFVIIEALASAVAMIKRSGVEAHVAELMGSGDLVLEFVISPGHESYVGWNDASVYGEFFDASYDGCWDHCNGITTVHRSGWCKVNQEHADMDCMCGVNADVEDEFYDWLDAQAEEGEEIDYEFEAESHAIDRAEDRALEAAMGIDDEPF